MFLHILLLVFCFSQKTNEKGTNGQSKSTLTVLDDNAPLCVVFMSEVRDLLSRGEKIYKKICRV